ncbi:MAG: DUF4215 domain-containing protein [Candidatus Woesearchaeota archaeon]|nr:MAG: DUF4215 domain-containing protein [Candidatus Woesearchaeota archaeon]
MNHRAAAIETIVFYSLTLLIVLGGVGFLLSSTIFEPTVITQRVCDLGSTFACEDALLTESGLFAINFRNEVARPVNITSVRILEFSSATQEFSTPLVLNPSESRQTRFDLNKEFAPGTTVILTLNFTYLLSSGSGIEYDALGTIVTEVAAREVEQALGAECGNGIIETGEQCDGASLGGATCLSQGYYEGGTMQCTANCQLDISQCFTSCGNGFAEPGEVCDDGAGNGQLCVPPPYGSACYYCNATCGNVRIDSPLFCGDAQIGNVTLGGQEYGEQCDDGIDNGGDYCNAKCKYYSNVFVTSQIYEGGKFLNYAVGLINPYTKNMINSPEEANELLAADAICNYLAKNSDGITIGQGAWIAWLGAMPRVGVLSHIAIPDSGVEYYVRSANESANATLVADSFQDLGLYDLYFPIMYDEYGHTVSDFVWTGLRHGFLFGDNCDVWTKSSQLGIVGDSTSTNFKWTDTGEKKTCENEYRLYCVHSSISLPRWCGNGIREDSEECDDGNWRDGDGCSSNCRNEH